MLSSSFIITVLLIVSVIFHEISHGWAAYFFGDRTAKEAGRLSLNPLKHIDPVGSVILPILLKLCGSSFVIGYAKPVPINPFNFRTFRLGMICVSLAGPLSNLFLSVIFAWLLGGFFDHTNLEFFNSYTAQILLNGIMINCALFLFNLVPILPLDGGRVLAALVPNKLAKVLYRLEPFGIFIVIGFGVLGPYLEKTLGIPLDFMGSVFSPACKWLYMYLVESVVSPIS